MKAEEQTLSGFLVLRRSSIASLLLGHRKQGLVLAVSLIAGYWVWHQPPVGAMDARGMHFLATLIVAITSWILDLADEYIVGLVLLLAWAVLDIAPTKLVLAGFSNESWFFTIAALGIAVALGQTSLLRRLSFSLLHWVPNRCHKTYTFCLLTTGLCSGLLLPTGKARAALAVPVTQSISHAAGFRARSNGAAAIALAGFMGFSQMSYVFLTGANQCLLAWSLLPQPIKADFGWLSWFLVALPSAVLITVFMGVAIHRLLPLSTTERTVLVEKNSQSNVDTLGPMSSHDWIAVAALFFVVVGWLTAHLHGINETWIALAGLLIFLLTGTLDGDQFKRKLDWGLVIFIGVLNSMGAITAHLEVDKWLIEIAQDSLERFHGGPYGFLIALFVVVSAARFLLRKPACAALFPLVLIPLSDSVGIHPGVLIVVSCMIAECFILGYQDGPYQIAFAGDGTSPFSHAQARKILAAKYLASMLAIFASVPYWRMLGLMR
jgi:divalent anion:Na+ symporter, DASS family